ncbi:MAG: AAA family ATPase [Rhodobacter sp.]|nr:AAA family ATPase [Rhodobacter sp.]
MDQTELVEFLSDPSTHGSDAPVEVITTHSAHVFLVGDIAYKIKRAVKYNYLDFTAPETRRDIIKHEHNLNAPAAPRIYDRVVAITREPSGELALEGSGEPIEYALRMHRFPREAELTWIADAGNLTIEIAEKLGTTTGRYHAAAETRTADGAVLIKEIVEELHEAFTGMKATLGHDRLAEYFARTGRMFERVASLLTERTKQGFVRRCHGDLHLKNLVMINGEPVPFDALEFDERLGTCDVAYDLAFLVMDLLHRDLDNQANVVLNSYLRTTTDFAGLAAMPLFLSIRAAIRSMVAVQTMSGSVSEEIAEDARNYLDQATRFLTPAPPRLVAVGGVSGTGKTTVSAMIAPILGPAPGAVHLRSDLERKALFGVDPLEKLPDDAYAPDVNEKVYARVLSHAEEILRAHHSVIVDATFLAEEQSAAIRALAERSAAAFDGIWLSADPDILARRVADRTGDASDADVAVLRKQLDRQKKPALWQEIDAGGDPETVFALVEACLFTV